MARTPSFSYPGGKVRLRSWLAGLFPPGGDRYVEPFAGMGNVFFHARKTLDYKHWTINDPNTEPFFRAVLEVDLDILPDTVDRQTFAALKESPQDALSRVLEPRVSYAGKGYKYGYRGDHGTHVGYRKVNYFPMLEAAKHLLRDVSLCSLEWDMLPYHLLGSEDFVYLDPPYLGTEIGTYPNIDHEKLLHTLEDAKFRWAISGYETDLYLDVLGPPQGSKERASEIAATNGISGMRRLECLWTNY